MKFTQQAIPLKKQILLKCIIHLPFIKETLHNKNTNSSFNDEIIHQ